MYMMHVVWIPYYKDLTNQSVYAHVFMCVSMYMSVCVCVYTQSVCVCVCDSTQKVYAGYKQGAEEGGGGGGCRIGGDV